MNKTVKFIIYLVLFTAILDLLLAFVLNYFDAKNRYGMSGGNINYYMEQPKPDILVMGSSRAHHYVIPDSLGNSAFNLSHNGMGMSFQTSLIDILEKRSALPHKYLLLEIEPEEFVVDEQPLLYDVQFINRYYRKNKYVREQINRISKYEFLKYTFRSFPLNGNIPSLIKNSITTFREGTTIHNGYSPAWPSPEDSTRTMITAGRRQKRDVGFEQNKNLDVANSEGLKYLRHAAELCRENNVQLVLFTTPYYAQSERFDYQDDLDQYFHDINLDYLDFTREPIEELLNPWLWTDNSHINHKGAQLFSRMLAIEFTILKQRNASDYGLK